MFAFARTFALSHNCVYHRAGANSHHQGVAPSHHRSIVAATKTDARHALLNHDTCSPNPILNRSRIRIEERERERGGFRKKIKVNFEPGRNKIGPVFRPSSRDGMTFRREFWTCTVEIRDGISGFCRNGIFFFFFWTMLDRICDNLFYRVSRYRCYIFAWDRMKFEVERDNIWSVESLWCNLFYRYIDYIYICTFATG